MANIIAGISSILFHSFFVVSDFFRDNIELHMQPVLNRERTERCCERFDAEGRLLNVELTARRESRTLDLDDRRERDSLCRVSNRDSGGHAWMI